MTVYGAVNRQYNEYSNFCESTFEYTDTRSNVILHHQIYLVMSFTKSDLKGFVMFSVGLHELCQA